MNGYGLTVEIIFLIGAAEYRVPAEEARRLEDVIRGRCVDMHGYPLDGTRGRACSSPT
jgi:hypothetical protein